MHWPAFTKTVPVADFKNADFILGGSTSAPPEVQEHGELHQALLLDDGAESDYIRSYVHRVSISRQALLNSDTSALATLPFQNGLAVSRAIGNAVFSLLTTNAALGDGTALFHADHGNLDSGAAPSATSLDTAFALMGAQVNGAGEYLNYKPRFAICGPSKASTLAQIRGAMNQGNASGESDGAITSLIDSRLAGTTKWFTVADPMHGGILVAVLAGTENRPRFEQITNAPSTAADGLHFKCGYDFRAVVGNFRALTYNPGG